MADDSRFWKLFDRESSYFRELRTQKAGFQHWTYVTIFNAMILAHAFVGVKGVLKWVWISVMGLLLLCHLVYTDVARQATIEEFNKLDKAVAENQPVDLDSESYEVPRLILNNTRMILLVASVVLFASAL